MWRVCAGVDLDAYGYHDVSFLLYAKFAVLSLFCLSLSISLVVIHFLSFSRLYYTIHPFTPYLHSLTNT